MTFDLVFYKRDNEPRGSIDDVISVISGNPSFAVRQVKDGYEFFYQNKLTGVYFVMYYAPQDKVPDFAGFEKAGLSVHLNYARPTFFALEALPVISELAERLSMLILDNQFSSLIKTPSIAKASTLIESWIKSNEWGVRAAWSRGEPIYYLPREQLDYLWKYLTLVKSLQEKLQVFVPTKVFAFKSKSNNMVTCSLWPNYMQQVFPIVDVVLIGSQTQAGSKLKGFAKLSEIRDVLQGTLLEVREPVQHILLSQELSGQTVKTLDRVHLVSPQDYSGVPWDQVVDVPPPAR